MKKKILFIYYFMKKIKFHLFIYVKKLIFIYLWKIYNFIYLFMKEIKFYLFIYEKNKILFIYEKNKILIKIRKLNSIRFIFYNIIK